ncbi:FAD synthase-like [Watersipora subatra]|uniref:FAD synthase-like n=1 Tax=Watersipora subatra TaxID=2589382 RepID=UPI00355BDA85
MNILLSRFPSRSGSNIGLVRLRALRKHMMSSTSGSKTVTVGLIIIGNELVKGQVQDSNSFYMCQRLHKKGVQVKTVVMVPDDFNMIEHYLREFSSKFTFVLTSGGIGPTHDDITFEAAAKAFRDEMKVDEALESIYKNYFKENYTETHKKLSTIPRMASLFPNNQGFPIVQMRNIFILPGVPRFLKLAIKAVEDHIGSSAVSAAGQTVYLTLDEMSIARKLSHVAQQFPEVTIGSYPVFDNNYYKVRITFESLNSDIVEQCVSKFRQSLLPGVEIDYNENPLDSASHDLKKMLRTELEAPLTEAMSVCTEALERYKLDEICISFNGGKDCTALLHIWYAVASQHPDFGKEGSLQALYIRNNEPFPEEDKFIEECINRYELTIMKFTGKIKEQLAEMKRQHPNIKAIIMGTRLTDPHGQHLTAFQPTDQGWPTVMRVNPILSFSYSNIWTLLRGLSLPYCTLYDDGYTSLGSASSTKMNPALKYVDSDGTVRYRPAYTLTDGELERAGRGSQPT